MLKNTFSRFTPYECENCAFEGSRESCAEARDLWERVTPGDVFTDRECPKCGALAFPKLED